MAMTRWKTQGSLHLRRENVSLRRLIQLPNYYTAVRDHETLPNKFVFNIVVYKNFVKALIVELSLTEASTLQNPSHQ